MKENVRHFGGLIVRHRKSAVFFERIGDAENTKQYAPYLQWRQGKETIRGEEIPHYNRHELDISIQFDKEGFKEFYEYLTQIASEAWATFEPKVADSMRSDYDSYWDKDIEDEGNLSFGRDNSLRFSAPFQPAKKNGIVRLYKFDRRKFKSFVYDLAEKVGV